MLFQPAVEIISTTDVVMMVFIHQNIDISYPLRRFSRSPDFFFIIIHDASGLNDPDVFSRDADLHLLILVRRREGVYYACILIYPSLMIFSISKT